MFPRAAYDSAYEKEWLKMQDPSHRQFDRALGVHQLIEGEQSIAEPAEEGMKD